MFCRSPIVFVREMSGKCQGILFFPFCMNPDPLTLLHSEWPKLYGVLAILSAVGLSAKGKTDQTGQLPGLIRVFPGPKCLFVCFVMFCHGSNYYGAF